MTSRELCLCAVPRNVTARRENVNSHLPYALLQGQGRLQGFQSTNEFAGKGNWSGIAFRVCKGGAPEEATFVSERGDTLHAQAQERAFMKRKNGQSLPEAENLWDEFVEMNVWNAFEWCSRPNKARLIPRRIFRGQVSACPRSS